MSRTLFNALQIFKLTMKLTVQPASVEVEIAFNACGLFDMTHNQCIVFQTKCVANSVNVIMLIFVIYAVLVPTLFDRLLLLLEPRASPTNL